MKRLSLCAGMMAMLLATAGYGDTQVQKVRKPVADAGAAAKESETGAIGEAAPTWESLKGTDGKQHSLSDLAEADAVAVVFTCNRCPVAVAYEDRLIALANDYKDKGVEIVAINVNRGDAEVLPAMKERAEEKGFNFAYLKDDSQKSGRAYGATVTPHVFLLDKDRNVVYMGAIDDSQNTDKVENHHLRDAIDSVLAGKTPEVATTKQFGCGIQYE